MKKPWVAEANKKRVWKEESRKKISNSLLGMKGEKNRNWKGNNVGYKRIHAWLQEKYGKASKCENKSCKKKSVVYDWALKPNKKYERKRDNFWMLCRSCHWVQDKKIKNLLKNAPQEGMYFQPHTNSWEFTNARLTDKRDKLENYLEDNALA